MFFFETHILNCIFETFRKSQELVVQFRLKAEASNIDADSELNRLKEARIAELEYVRAQNELEIKKSKDLAGRLHNL